MTDPKSQGYVGITTKSVASRYASHKHRAKMMSNLHIYCAMRKYGDSIRVSTLHEDTLEFCQLLEWAYRSEQFIAWNTGIGGDSPRVGSKASVETRRMQSERQLGRKHTEETKAVMSATKLGKVQSDSSKQNRAAANKSRSWTDEARTAISVSRKGKPMSDETKAKLGAALKGVTKGVPKPNATKTCPWTHIYADEHVWSLAQELHYRFITESKISQPKIATFASTTLGRVASMYRRFKAGWNPNEDTAYLRWIEEYQSHKIKECNESTRCTQAACQPLQPPTSR